MKLQRFALPVKQWGSLVTKYRPSTTNVGDDEFTSGSKNFDTNTAGVITKALGGVNYNVTPLTTAPKDQFEAVFSDGVRHLIVVEGGRLSYTNGGGTFSLVTSSLAAGSNFEFALYQQRVYMGNGTDTLVYDRVTSYGGVTYTAPKTKTAGAQAPGTGPSGSQTTGGSIADGTYHYKVTFLYYGAEESNGGTASGAVTVSAGSGTAAVNLTSIPIGGYGVTAREIYRSSDGIVYRHVGEVADNTTTTFKDTANSGDEQMPTDNGVPPPFTLIVNHADRNWMAGVSGSTSTLFYTEAGQPDIVASDDFITCNPADPITALAVFSDRIIVFNRRSMGQIVGDTPDTFAYQALPGNIGCVDNRSIQIRIVSANSGLSGTYGAGGVPTLMWLSDKGFYEYNGATVVYLSDKIEDLVNFNIQQATQVKGQHTETTQTDFQAGTASGGIDLTTFPGTITTKNPKRTWDVQADWDGGSSLTNCATTEAVNALEVPTAFAPDYTTGTLTPAAIVTSGSLTLTANAGFTGLSEGTVGLGPITDAADQSASRNSVASRIFIPRAGTLTRLATWTISSAPPGADWQLTVWADDGFGSPGAVQYHDNVAFAIPSGRNKIERVVSVPLAAGWYWVGGDMFGNVFTGAIGVATTSAQTPAVTSYSFTSATGTDGHFTGALRAYGGVVAAVEFDFSPTPVAGSGQWLSATDDSGSASTDGTLTYSHTGTYPATTSAQTSLEASADASTWTVLRTTASLNGSDTVVVSAASHYRYFRIRIQPATTDDRHVPTIGTPTLKFNVNATWISEAIDCTSDVSAYVSGTLTDSVPAGTSVTLTAASSADNVTYTSYGALGGISVQRYIKFKIVLAATSNDATTPSVTALAFAYTIAANWVEAIVDLTTEPAGWDIFQSAFAANGGTVVFKLRDATTSGGVSSASYTVITPGTFPALTAHRYAQLRVEITSNADQVPTVDSLTLNWFIAQISSIRAASLFFNKTYYLAVAKAGATTNNLLIVFDWQGNWRVRDDLTISTLGFFFNDPYYGDATVGQFVRWQIGTTNANGSSVSLDLRTKAFDLGDNTRRKVLRKLFATLGDTGATWTFDYSLDNGQTFKTLVDASGASTVTTPVDGAVTVHRFAPLSADLTGAKTIMFRARTSDAFAAELHELHIDAFVRQGEILA